MIRLNNNILVDIDGVPLGLNTTDPLEFTMTGNKFPVTNSNAALLEFSNTGTNIIYIDFGDGSDIYSKTFYGNYIYKPYYDGTLYNYSSIETRTIKIWFEFPWKITTMRSDFFVWGGNFIKNLGLYKLSNVNIANSSFNNLESFRGGIYGIFTLFNTVTIGSSVPESILGSRIVTLGLSNGFNLLNITTNKLNRLNEIVDLTNLNVPPSTALPDNFRDLPRLRTFECKVSTIVENLGKCNQITTLSLGALVSMVQNAGNGGCNLSSWGYGIGEMTNLTKLYAEGSGKVSTFPTTEITGLEALTKLKSINFRSVFATQLEIDTFIDNLYTQVTTNQTPGSVITDTPLRGISFDLTNASGVYPCQNKKPSGTYPTSASEINGFVLLSSNGNPTTPLQKIYVLVKNYKWTFKVVGNTYAP